MTLVAIGLLAGSLTTLAFVPQVVHTWRQRSANDLSLTTYVAFCAGLVLWLAYGIARRDLPLILANGITLALASAILVMKIRFDRARPAGSAPKEASAPPSPPKPGVCGPNPNPS